MVSEYEELKYEPLGIEERQRDEAIPVGLKNVGNTCYFNSILQAMFFLPNVTTKIIQHDFDKTQYPRHEQDSVQQKRQMSSVQMVKELQKIYS